MMTAPSAKVRIATLVAAGWAELTLMRAGVLTTTALACGLALLAARGAGRHPSPGRDREPRTPGRRGRRDDRRHAHVPLERGVDA